MARFSAFLLASVLILFFPAGAAAVSQKPLYTIDVKALTGESVVTGVDFDGTHWWVSGGAAPWSLYRIDFGGSAYTRFVVPAASLAPADIARAAAGAVYAAAYEWEGLDNEINEFVDGVKTGNRIEVPFSRPTAQAYRPASDTYWVASWSGDFYEIDNVFMPGGSFTTVPDALGLDKTGFAAAGSTLWVFCREGAGECSVYLWDTLAHAYTGESWSADAAAGKAAGCCVFEDPVHGPVFAGVQRGGTDVIAVYPLFPAAMPQADITCNGEDGPLTLPYIDKVELAAAVEARGGAGAPVDVWCVLHSSTGGLYCYDGTWHFGVSRAAYTGPLADASAVVLDRQVPPAVYTAGLAIDAQPNGKLDMGAVIAFDTVAFTVLAAGEYRYDDGSTENLLGLTNGGDLCWLHRFDAIPGGETILDVQTIFGCAAFPGLSPGNGTPCTVFVWEDPTDDGDPDDCVLLRSQPAVVANVDTDLVNVIPLAAPAVVSGEFYVGVVLTHAPNQFVVPVDTSTPYTPGNAWFAGTNSPGGFDPSNLAANQYPPLQYGYYWCLRAGF